MNERRTIRADIHAGGADDEANVGAERFREAFARWAATVAVVAVRDDRDRVHATTVSSFAPVSALPPLIAICLGAGAQVLPFATEGSRVGVSVLHQDQSRWASVFADSFPVSSPSWTGDATPWMPGAVAWLGCTVRAIHPTEGGSRVLLCHVDEIELGDDDRPLLYWQRGYHRLDES